MVSVRVVARVRVVCVRARVCVGPFINRIGVACVCVLEEFVLQFVCVLEFVCCVFSPPHKDKRRSFFR